MAKIAPFFSTQRLATAFPKRANAASSSCGCKDMLHFRQVSLLLFLHPDDIIFPLLLQHFALLRKQTNHNGTDHRRKINRGQLCDTRHSCHNSGCHRHGNHRRFSGSRWGFFFLISVHIYESLLLQLQVLRSFRGTYPQSFLLRRLCKDR